MPEIVVAASSRTETGKNCNRRLRAQGLIPGVLYGAGKPPASLSVSPKEIVSILRSGAGENTLFDLELAGARRKVILKEFQVEPLKDRLLHADFFEVALDKPIQVDVHVELHGVPVGVKTQGGLLDFVTRELEIECLPLDIPQKVVVDVSGLELGRHLRVSDLVVGDKVKVLTGPEVVVAHVVAPKAEVSATAEAEAEAAAATAAAEPEVIKKGKTEVEGEEKADKKGEKKAEKKEKK
ncbi:MAG TPA: 50S ribosomal protein L25 [Vicinamibacteria bacterium]|nr:50S ribosomal protein L25 [Vicinamibacteria bacterium]